jgi:hypothetical protein
MILMRVRRRRPSFKLAQADEPHVDAISALTLDFLFFLLLKTESCLK